jgi:flavorubredoxin
MEPPFELAVKQRHVLGTDVDVISTDYPIPGFGLVPINAFLFGGEVPILVDTGAVLLQSATLSVLERLVDLSELRWLFLTHADLDHIGCVNALLARCPKLKIITSFLGLGKLGLQGAVAPDRVFLLNPGQHLSIGDRELVAVKTPTFDAPETTAVIDAKTRVLFSADCFGAVLDRGYEGAADVDARILRDGMVTWATLDSPWLHATDPTSYEHALAMMESLGAEHIFSAHLPPARGSLMKTLLGNLAQARTAAPFVGPDQNALQGMLSGAPPAQREEGGKGAPIPMPS